MTDNDQCKEGISIVDYSFGLIRGEVMVISIVDVAGVGPSTAALLAEHGISSAESLAETPHDRLVSIPGVGAVRAWRLSEAAARAVGDAPGKEERGDKNDEKKKQKDKKGKDKKRKDKKRKIKKKILDDTFGKVQFDENKTALEIHREMRNEW